MLGILRTCNPVNAGEYQYILSNIVGCDAYYSALAGPDGDAGTGDDLAPMPTSAPFRDAVGVKAVDDTTIEFTLQNPGPTFQVILSLWMTFPVPAHLFPDPSAAWPAESGRPGCTGLQRPVHADRLRGRDQRNARAEPELEGGVQPGRLGADAGQLRAALDRRLRGRRQRAYENDELDMSTVDLTQLAATEAQYEPTGEYQKHIKAGTRGLQMNEDHPPLDNMDVRMGIGKAVDWQKMIDQCYGGGARVHHHLDPGGRSWWPGAGLPRRRVRVRRGRGQGTRRRRRRHGPRVRSSSSASGTETECQGEFIQEALRANLGMNIKLEVVEGPVRSARFREETFDLFPGGWTQDYPDPENWIIGLFDTDGPLNHYNCSEPEIDQLIDDNTFNLDNDARIAAYERINEIIVDEVCGIFVYYHEADNYLVKPTRGGHAGEHDRPERVHRRRLGCRGLGSQRVSYRELAIRRASGGCTPAHRLAIQHRTCHNQAT